ncbi:AfsR/SARP family transcriptional regulator [Microlunatus flavus]|uniref:Transcriptional regulatory protein, C terminal n=1 Tax=Microlunatus flavus TaxID=1036181 RepID=A0A1H9JH25_9ACTN|nr:AfsR/SARP family transcriptional regulator [Microlunatus flavus]SEQ86078.1 Transcriptional regulatory protein, C terminal [Microlunatus flavus]
MRISVLGPVTLLAGPEAVDLGPPRHRALFAALVVDAGHVVAAEVLQERVWGLGPSTAPGTLHSAVSHLRRRLRPHPELTLQTRAPGYLLRTGATSVDAVEFSALLVRSRTQAGSGNPVAARACIDEALGLWRGQPYADVDADFARAEADRLTALRLAAVELGAELDLVLGRHAELATTLPAIVAEHPLREGLRASLVLALYRSGRQGDALRAYAEGREILSDELGVDPGPALRRLHAGVLAQDPALDLPAPASTEAARARTVHRPSVTPEEPADGLVGRTEERTRLAALLTLSSPQVRAAVVVGEAGVGKTALVEAVVAGLPGSVEVEWGRCWDHDSTAGLWLWSQALGALARRRGPTETAVLVSESGPEVEGLLGRGAVPDPSAGGEVNRARLFMAVAGFLGAAARRRPLVVVLEDLHWADQDSADLLGFVLETVRDVPLRIVGTVRSPSDTATDRGPGLLADLARRSAVVRLDLAGLDVGEVAELAETQLGRPVRPEQAAALHERTNGNPFFISELVRLRQHETEAPGRAGGPVPDNVRTVVERRLTHLPAGTVDLLGVAAVLGRELSLSLLARVLGRRAVDLAEDVDAAVAHGIVAPVEDLERLRFSHALVQETLVAGLGPMRRAGLHAAAAATLEELPGDRRERAAQIASHWAAAGLMGDVDRAVAATLLAAEVDLAASAPSEAERHLRRALDLARQAPGATAEVLELEVRTRLATLLTLVRGYNDDAVALERRRSFELAERLGSAPHLLPALWGRWGIALVSGDFDQAYADADALEEAGRRAGDAMLGAAAHLARGQTHWHRGRLGSARQELEQAVEAFAGHAGQVRLDVFLQHPEPTAAVWLSLVLAQLGEQQESDAAAARAAAHPAVTHHPFTSIYRWVTQGFRWAVRGEPDQALRSEVGLADAVRLGFDQLAVFSLLPVGWGHGSSGQLDRGLTELRTAREALGSVAERPAFVTMIWWLVADLHHRVGDERAALAALVEAERAGSDIGEHAVLVERLALEAQVLRRLGRLDDAVEREGRLERARRERLL